MKRRVPRKIKKQIPEGMYCYTPTSSFSKMKDGQWGYTIKLCPMLSYRKRIDIFEHLDPWDREYIKENPEDAREFSEDYVGYCKFVKCKIDDQCKSCSLKQGKWYE
jgi:hypothetical protein